MGWHYHFMATIGKDIAEAKDWLESGQVAGIPTETVYGLAANALDAQATLQIFKVKNRPSFDPLIVHTSSPNRISDFTGAIPEALMALADHFWPGPLTLLLPRSSKISDVVTAGLPRVAVRIPNHPLTLELLENLDFPVAAPSANPFGYISPTTARHVQDQLGDIVPYILDGGPAQVGIESTIVGMEGNELVVYRLGGLDIASIQSIAGTSLRINPHSSSNPAAPGMLKSHYAPKIPVVMEEPGQLLKTFAPHQIGMMNFSELDDRIPKRNQVILSTKQDLDEAARNFFGALRTLDQLDLAIISAELVPNHGLGKAINDRLRRAASEG